MKKYLIIIIILTILLAVYLTKSSKKAQPEKIIYKSPPKVKTVVKERKSLFVPEWNINENNKLPSGYNRFIYFGNTYPRRSLTIGKEEWWFTVKINELPTPSEWPEIVKNDINIANNYKASGIVLDLEINGLPTENLINQINNFVGFFYTQTRQYYIKLAVAIYGDVFYRRRPFDLRFINQNSDEIMVMAYDFHKSRGNPGPNFPYGKGDKYDYDFQTMVEDFLQFVPPEKLTVIFGMYGYDWLVDEKKRPISQAKALTLNEIKNKFLVKCEWKDCVVKRDDISKEMEVNYTFSAAQPDEQGIYRIDYHIVWFEDEESAKVKAQYLKEKGIGSVAYWAYGYF